MVYQESVKENHDYINGLIMIALIIICPPIGIILALFCLYKGYNNWKINVFCISYAIKEAISYIVGQEFLMFSSKGFFRQVPKSSLFFKLIKCNKNGE